MHRFLLGAVGFSCSVVDADLRQPGPTYPRKLSCSLITAWSILPSLRSCCRTREPANKACLVLLLPLPAVNVFFFFAGFFSRNPCFACFTWAIALRSLFFKISPLLSNSALSPNFPTPLFSFFISVTPSMAALDRNFEEFLHRIPSWKCMEQPIHGLLHIHSHLLA